MSDVPPPDDTTDTPVDTADRGSDERAVTDYLARVGLAHRPRDEIGLAELAAAHQRTLPFENLDPLRGVPVADLGLGALSDKLVHRGRGGYCYEHNPLLGHVLRHLGHEVEVLTGRVGWDGDPGATPVPPRTHAVLSVRLRGGSERHLVDVGFGGQTPASPLLLDSTDVQETRHEPCRLRPVGDWLVVESLVHDQWRLLYTLGREPQQPIDLEVGSWWVSTHPDSGFRRELRVARITDDARLTLGGTSYGVHRVGRATERRELDGVDGVLASLERDFLVDVAGLDGLPEALARVLG